MSFGGTLEVLNHTLTDVGKTTDGHTAWLRISRAG